MRLFLACLLLSSSALADTVRTSDGVTCSFDSGDTPYQLETYVDKGSDHYDGYNYDQSQRESNVGIKFTYKFGGPKRLNCDALYRMELRAKEARLKQLEQQIKAMEAVAAAQW
ncbi:hypothetical protein [uncultured Ferrimonas sp.]|uniref:hypothetical protein n=1 Tax=uncultured Ferrimonas sp. TaxID=432640 RepID=UPI00261B9E72|nr:hypothetical protein [uncultured Ferrimonas sp.]